MQKICYLAVLSWFLVACGGSGGEGGIGPDMGPSLADISGAWDATLLGDERYIVFKEKYKDEEEVTVKASVITYDFDGDSVDFGDNCYHKSSDEIVDLGYGDFEITEYSINENPDRVIVLDQFLIHVELSGDELTILNDGVTTIYPKSMHDESLFAGLLCGEFEPF